MKAKRINHIAIAVNDLDTAVETFTKDFGLTLIREATNGPGTLGMAFLEVGDTVLQLVTPIGPGPVRDFLDTKGEGLHHICFDVESLKEATETHPGGPIDKGGLGGQVSFLKESVHGAVIELSAPLPEEG